MVWPLAWRCRTSRSVKNACRVGASAVMTDLPGRAARCASSRCPATAISSGDADRYQ